LVAIQITMVSTLVLYLKFWLTTQMQGKARAKAGNRPPEDGRYTSLVKGECAAIAGIYLMIYPCKRRERMRAPGQKKGRVKMVVNMYMCSHACVRVCFCVCLVCVFSRMRGAHLVWM